MHGPGQTHSLSALSWAVMVLLAAGGAGLLAFRAAARSPARLPSPDLRWALPHIHASLRPCPCFAVQSLPNFAVSAHAAVRLHRRCTAKPEPAKSLLVSGICVCRRLHSSSAQLA